MHLVKNNSLNLAYQLTSDIIYQPFENRIGGVTVSMLVSSAVDRGFIGGVMVSMLASSAVDHGFIGGVTVSMLASSAVDRGFEPRLGRTKDNKIGICCFSAKHAALRSKSKDWLAQNQNNVSEWGCFNEQAL
jgi:hypothetical protein